MEHFEIDLTKWFEKKFLERFLELEWVIFQADFIQSSNSLLATYADKEHVIDTSLNIRLQSTLIPFLPNSRNE